VIDAAEIDQSWSTSTLPQRCSMSTLDEIAKEKQRVSEALARIDAQREKLSGQLSELEAAERVLARYGTDTQAKRTTSRETPTRAAQGVAQAQSGRRRRTRAAKSARIDRGSPSLGDPCPGNGQDTARNRRRMQGGSPEPYRHCDCPAQAGWPNRGARRQTLYRAFNRDGATRRGLTRRKASARSNRCRGTVG
jgi:hypothetical protein